VHNLIRHGTSDYIHVQNVLLAPPQSSLPCRPCRRRGRASGLAQRTGAHELVHPVLLLRLALHKHALAVHPSIGQRAGCGAQAGALQERLRRGLVQEDDSAVTAQMLQKQTKAVHAGSAPNPPNIIQSQNATIGHVMSVC
jgi:hypothetical protein